MIYIKKKKCSKRLEESINAIKHSDAWKSANDKNTVLLRECFDLLDKEEIKTLLIEEQHRICAYCMSRITLDNMVIDHWKPLSAGKKYALDYRNFAGCCCGGRKNSGERELCCDASKENKKITINPWDKSLMDKIKYTSDGKIVFDGEDAAILSNINYILKLNGELDSNGQMLHDTSTKLVENRKRQYKKFRALMHKMNDKKYSQSRIASELQKYVRNLETKDEYEEYIGVLIYFMKRKIAVVTRA